MTRAIIPAVILLATLTLIGYAARDLILPATEVDMVRAVAVAAGASDGDDASARQASGPATVVAQAPGWVEPDPYPVYVSTLADGVVEHIHVLEGEPVKAGQLLVQLVDEDAKLSLDRARAQLARREASLVAANADFEEPVSLIRAEAVARAKLAEAKAALIRLDAETAREQARLDELVAANDRLQKMSEQSVSALQVDAAGYQVTSQRAVVKATGQRRPELEAKVAEAAAHLAAAERELELKTTLRRTRDEAAAAVEEARAAVAEAELRVERMTIRSPTDGVVIERLVVPGAKLMLGMDGKHSAHAIHLYDPQSLQVRVDVPLADAAAVGVEQDAIIIVDVLPDQEFAGVVTRVVHQADIAKNTVQFKVAIAHPSPLLKPDMLARVKFLGRAGNSARESGDAPTASAAGSVAIARTAIIEPPAGEPFVWWISPIDQRIEQRAVTLGRNRSDGVVEVHTGLNPGDVVVNDPATSLQPGERVEISNN